MLARQILTTITPMRSVDIVTHDIEIASFQAYATTFTNRPGWAVVNRSVMLFNGSLQGFRAVKMADYGTITIVDVMSVADDLR